MNFIGGRIANKYVSKRIVHEFGVQDPYHEYIEYTLDDGTTKTEKKKRALPVGISAHDEKILVALRKRAYKLELFFSILGVNVGWTAVIGFIPLVGAIWNLYLGLNTIKMAEKVEGGIPNWHRTQMMGNIAIDTGLGFIPFLGDIIQAIYKGNTRNVIILEHLLAERGQKSGAQLPPIAVQPGLVTATTSSATPR